LLRQAVPAADLPFEFMMNALRLCEGFDAHQFAARTGLDFAVLQRPIERACARGLLETERGRWRASPRGFNFLNDLVAEFLPPLSAPGTSEDQSRPTRHGAPDGSGRLYAQRRGPASAN